MIHHEIKMISWFRIKRAFLEDTSSNKIQEVEFTFKLITAAGSVNSLSRFAIFHVIAFNRGTVF